MLATCVMELLISSCIRGYHVYGEIWTAVLGKQLFCEHKIGNVVDRYAVAAKNDFSIVVRYLGLQFAVHFPSQVHSVHSDHASYEMTRNT